MIRVSNCSKDLLYAFRRFPSQHSRPVLYPPMVWVAGLWPAPRLSLSALISG